MMTTFVAGIPIRQDVVPMAVGFGLTMATLGLALWVTMRRGRGLGGANGPPERRGWPAFIRYLLGTALGGWATLMAIVLLYYVAVAGQGRRFLLDALTGTALMAFGIGVPSLLLIAWVVDLWRRRRDRRLLG
jgi:Family of unknown function (DUF6256)